jgi:hypothetical protein
MNDRDYFAAAALFSGMGVLGYEQIAKTCYEMADVMLRERERTIHDAVPEARAESDEARTDKAATSHRRDGTGDTPSEAEINALECLIADATEFLLDMACRRVARTHYEGCRRDHVECLIAALVEGITGLRDAIRRLADQDATLSIKGGDVIVTMDATLTNEEREAVKMAALYMYCPILRDLSERLQVQQDFSSSAPVSGSGKPAVAGNTQPTFTDEEREAVEAADAYMSAVGCRNTNVQKTLRGLLERLK